MHSFMIVKKHVKQLDKCSIGVIIQTEKFNKYLLPLSSSIQLLVELTHAADLQ